MRHYTLILKVAILALLSGLSVSAHAETIGVIMTGDIPYYQEIHKAFVAEVSKAGKVNILLQTPTPEPMSWSNAARKLIVSGSNVIICYGVPATLTAMKETSSVPIIFAGVYDPAAMQITGKNATGISSTVSVGTILEKLKKIAPFKKLGVVFNKSEKDTILQTSEIKKLEGSMGFEMVPYNVKQIGDTVQITNVDALFLTTACAGMVCVNDIVGIARNKKLPTASAIGGGENKGILLTMTADPDEQGMEAAKMAAKVLKGSKPSDIPIQSPKRIETVINLKEAEILGVQVPSDLISSATRTIK